MLTCPSCSQANPDGFRLCGMCGTQLAAPPASRVERKVVSVLFCDLAGFTAQAEQLDPEDVQALLRPYHAMVRDELVRHGGTVEKFIGDAVVALFGAPVAHEDDPERAVRAALAIRDHALERHLELRVGVTTGEALVTLETQPGDGTGMASGDVVNTAARLQSAAPVNGILADVTTYRATRGPIEYETAPPVAAKGKSAPVEVWAAVSARSRVEHDGDRHSLTELVGRDRELGVLRSALERTLSERTSQLVTLVGVPGIGKSRLIHELGGVVDDLPDLITWRRGRCLAYGDGNAFWAFGEMIKAHAGILETDSELDAARKLGAVVEAAIVDEDERAWIILHLRSLVGLEVETSSGEDRHGEAFAAWRRYLEALGDERPLVLVFEDLHWADEGLLDFVDQLVDRLSDVPLLVVATTRPELLERRPGWGGGKLNATTIGLSPLSDDETTRIIEHLLQRASLPQETLQLLLGRAEGNPLYAEQFSELFLEQGSAGSMALPETLQGIIAARIDGLTGEEKAVLQDAAVVGKVFWSGALEREERDLDEVLSGLARKGFLARRRRSSVAREDEWSFGHILLRDVAYAQIARTERSHKHRHTAEWLEALGRPEDHAAVIAYHWRTALELARAAGQPVVVLEEPTRRSLRAAGERAFAVNSYAEAARHLEAALDMWPTGDERRPALLYRYAEALYLVDSSDAPEALTRARDALLQAGQRDLAAGAELMLSRIAWHAGRPDEARSHHAAAESLAGDGTTLMATKVLAYGARTRTIGGDLRGGLEMATRALAMADALGAEELRAHALCTMGLAGMALGRTGARELVRQALDIAVALRSPEAGSIANNLAVTTFLELRMAEARELFEEGLRTAEYFGDASGARWLRSQVAIFDWVIGDWDAFLNVADALIARSETGSPHYDEASLRIHRARVRLARGEVDGASSDVRTAIGLGRELRDPQESLSVIGAAVLVLEETGRQGEAEELVSELVEGAERHPFDATWTLSLDFLFSRTAAGHERSLRAALSKAPDVPWKAVAIACLDGDFVRAADLYSKAGSPTLESRLRLRAAEHLAEAGRLDESRIQAQRALEFHRAVGASRYVDLETRLLEP